MSKLGKYGRPFQKAFRIDSLAPSPEQKNNVLLSHGGKEIMVGFLLRI